MNKVKFCRLSLLLSLLLFNNAVYAETLVEGLVRMGVWSQDPSSLRAQVHNLLIDWGADKAGELELGTSTEEGYYFHTQLPHAKISELVQKLDGEVRFSIERDSRVALSSEGQSRLILTVAHFPSPHLREDVRVFHLAEDSQLAMDEFVQKLSALGVASQNLAPVSYRDGRLQELRFNLKPEDSPLFLGALQESLKYDPFEIQAPKQSQAIHELKVRYVVEQAPQGSVRLRESSAQPSMLYNLRLSTWDYRQDQQAMTEFLKELGAEKGGRVELGDLVADRPYYHFVLREEALLEAIFYLAQVGHLKVEGRPHARRLAPGQTRAILNVFSLHTPLIDFRESEEVVEIDEEEIAHEATELLVESQAKPFLPSIYRPAMGLQALLGGIPASPSGEIEYLGYAQLSLWWGERRENPDDWLEIRRFGVRASVLTKLTDNVPAQTMEPIETYDLKYRFTPKAHERNSAAVVSLSAQRSYFGRSATSFGGLSLEYFFEIPEFLDNLVNWLPLFDFPKRMALGGATYPWALGQDYKITRNLMFYIEPKMFFHPRFYLVGRGQWNGLKYQTSSEQINVDFIIGQAGFGFLF